MIFCHDKIYAKVWDVKKSEKYIDLHISTSEKNTDDTRIYSSWYPRAIGHAFNSLKDVKEGDNIVITKSKLSRTKFQDKDGNSKYALDFIILEVESQDDNSQKVETTTNNTASNAPAESVDSGEPW